MIDFNNLDAKSLAKVIDFSILPKETTEAEIREGCGVTRRYGFAAFYSSSAFWTPVVRAELSDMDDIEIGTGIAFPFGSAPAAVKGFEVEDAVRRGCTAVDMVMNIGALRGKDYSLVLEDITKVVTAARPAKVKVILETGMLNDEEKVAACTLAKLAGAHFVKTSTGFGKGGATTSDVSLMRRVVGAEMGVKASGGIRSRQNAELMVEAGASRLGASASVAIITGGGSTSRY